MAGVQHVADCVSVTTDNQELNSGVENYVELLDGSTVVMVWDVPSPSFAAGMGQVSLCGLSVVGTAGNSMTLEFNGHGSETSESVNLIGRDAT